MSYLKAVHMAWYVRPTACRAYEAVKAHQTAEAARRAEEERLTNLLYAEEIEVRAADSAYWACKLKWHMKSMSSRRFAML